MIDTIKKIQKLMSPDSVKAFRLLIILSIFAAIIETFGLAFIFPFIAILSVPHYLQHSKMLTDIYQFCGFTTQNQFLLLLASLLLATVVFGNMLIAYSMWRIYRFSYLEEHRISYSLLKKYMTKPYVFFLSRNTNFLLKNVTDEVKAVSQNILISLLKIVTKLTVATLMLLFLLVYSPLLTLMIVVSVLFLYGSFTTLFRQYIKKKSEESITANALIYKYTAEALGSIQDIKLMHASDFVLKQFSRPSTTYALSRSAANTVSDTPRYLLDVFLFGGILLYVVIMLANNSANLAHIIPTLAMFGYAGMRLMPATSVIYNSYTAIKFAKPSLDLLYRDLNDDRQPTHSAVEETPVNLVFKKALKFENVSYTYPDAQIEAIHELSFVIPAFSKIGVVGKTGAGKTTVINLLLGLLSPTKGCISVDDIALTEKQMRAWQSDIGYVPQFIYLIDDTIAKNIAFGLEESEIDLTWLETVSKQAELHDFIMRDCPNHYNTHVGDRGVRLSGGQRQRIGIARALYRRPKLLVLDEATSSLDNVTEKALLNNIDHISNHMTVIMVAHRLTTLRKCDTIFVLSSDGIAASGTYDSLSETSEIFRGFLQMENKNE